MGSPADRAAQDLAIGGVLPWPALDGDLGDEGLEVEPAAAMAGREIEDLARAVATAEHLRAGDVLPPWPRDIAGRIADEAGFEQHLARPAQFQHIRLVDDGGPL